MRHIPALPKGININMEEKKLKDSTEENWLARIQEQSWEPEILISGIVLFALFRVPPLIQDLNLFLNNNSIQVFSSGNVDENLSALLILSNGWLILGFSTHLFIRSIWVAFIGLSYVYKDGINFSNLKYRSAFRKEIIKNSDYIDIIHKLEKACSATFAISFLWFLCVLGITFSLLVVGALINLLFYFFPDQVSDLAWIDTAITVVFFIHIFDFVTLGVLKRIKYVSKVYYPIYMLISYLTLSPLYRGIYYGFVSNHKWWKIALFMLLFVTSSVFLTFAVRGNQNLMDMMVFKPLSDKNQLFHGHYENLANGAYSRNIILPSDVIKGDILRVFIVHRTTYEEQSIKKLCNYEEQLAQDSVDVDDLKMECLTQFYDLKINGKEIESSFLFHQHKNSNQDGLVTYIDISDLEQGAHLLELVYNIWEKEKLEHKTKVIAEVEFYKVR